MRVVCRMIAALAVVAACWQVVVWLFQPPHFILPEPVTVAAFLIERWHYLGLNASITVVEIMLGLLFGTFAGIVTVLLLAGIPAFRHVVWPVLLTLQALPVFAIAPLLVLWFGFGLASNVAMASLIIFFPVASAFADGLQRTSRDLVDAASLHAGNAACDPASRSPAKRLAVAWVGPACCRRLCADRRRDRRVGRFIAGARFRYVAGQCPHADRNLVRRAHDPRDPYRRPAVPRRCPDPSTHTVGTRVTTLPPCNTTKDH